MRTALHALTTRGRVLLSSGVTAAICSLALGLDDLLRVGVLLLALPLLAAGLVGRGRHRMSLSRTVSPLQVSVGQPSTVTLRLGNEGSTPTGLLLLEERVPLALGVRPRFVVDRMGVGRHRTVSYRVRSDVRGRFPLGPMAVRVGDPFGLVELDRTFRSVASLVVTPRVVPLPTVPLSGAWTATGDNRPRHFAGGSAEDVTVRQYRRGDELRRVHWRSSAHAGELMVRREEQPWQSRATIVIDNRQDAHRGVGALSSLEYAVTVAASAASHLVERGFRVRLVTAEGLAGGWHEHGHLSTETGPMLESLAVLTLTRRSALDASWLNEPAHVGVVLAVLGRTRPADTVLLERMRHSASSPLAVVLDVDRWERREHDGSPAGDLCQLLGATGWRAVPAAPTDPVEAVWQRLGSTARRRTAGSPMRLTGGSPT